MILIENIVASLAAAREKPAAEQYFIDFCKSSRDVYPKNSVKEPNWSFATSMHQSQFTAFEDQYIAYRNAGSLPNRATNTKPEIPRMASAMVRSNPILLRVEPAWGVRF